MSIDKTTESINDFNRALATANLSPELQEFVKVFPPPYRYVHSYMGNAQIYSNSNLGITLTMPMETSLEEDAAFGELICTLLNKHFINQIAEEV